MRGEGEEVAGTREEASGAEITRQLGQAASRELQEQLQREF